MRHHYLIALGSNMRVPGVGSPPQVVATALAALEAEGLAIETSSRILGSAPLGPSARRYANAAAVIATPLTPPELLAVLQRVERVFGRRRRGRKWRARPLDLDIVLWSGGTWTSAALTIPHPAFRSRAFVLDPATAIAATWRDPLTALSLRHLRHRLTRPRRVPSERPCQAAGLGP